MSDFIYCLKNAYTGEIKLFASRFDAEEYRNEQYDAFNPDWNGWEDPVRFVVGGWQR